jgi:sec-independent protein translocase protein TatA
MIGFGIPHGMELLIVLAVVLLLFGHRLPGMARSLGSGITEFKRGLKDGSSKKDGSADSSSGDSSSGDSDSSGSR